MTDNEKLIKATEKLKNVRWTRDPVTYWPTAFWIASIWISLGWMVMSISQCVMSVKG